MVHIYAKNVMDRIESYVLFSIRVSCDHTTTVKVLQVLSLLTEIPIISLFVVERRCKISFSITPVQISGDTYRQWKALVGLGVNGFFCVKALNVPNQACHF
jgi:hypothetical protein